MATRLPVYLLTFRLKDDQPKQFALFIPHAESMEYCPSNWDKWTGWLLHIDGDPILGYWPEGKAGYMPGWSKTLLQSIPIGEIPLHQISPRGGRLTDSLIGRLFTNVQAPDGMLFSAEPITEEPDRQCQKWIMDFLRRLVASEILHADCLEKAEAARDPPSTNTATTAAPEVPKAEGK